MHIGIMPRQKFFCSQQWRIKRIDKQKKSHTAIENHPVTHKKCRSHRNNFTGCWNGSWDVEVILCYWREWKKTSLRFQLTPQFSNFSMRTRCQELSQPTSLWSALVESMGWAVTLSYLKVLVALKSGLRCISPLRGGTVSRQAWGLQFSTMVVSSTWV